MHQEQLSFVSFTQSTDFLITSSIDGTIKFWKKVTNGVEFVKEFKAHEGEIISTSISSDGRNFATAGVDGSIKIFDVVTFDLLSQLIPNDKPRCICYVYGSGSSFPLLAVTSSAKIDVYDGEHEKLLYSTSKLHKSPIITMVYNTKYDCVISADESGMIEYWQPTEQFDKPNTVFSMKSSTNLFEFKKSKSIPTSITTSPSGEYFSTISFPDRKIRIFEFKTGKLYRTYDESINTITEMQQAGTAINKLEDNDFSRRIGIEKGLDNATRMNIIFDESSNFILYGSILGIKVINMLTNTVVKVYGMNDSFRCLNLALYQGQPDKKKIVTTEMLVSDNPLLQQAEMRDAMLVTTGFGKVRFYMFTNDEEINKSNRDVYNEKPRNLSSTSKTTIKEEKIKFGKTATIYTTMGDIIVKLFPEYAPKAVENFTIHSKNDYYNNLTFHRVIRKFMIQTGDPLGDGTGGESIWNKEFEDEFTPLLRHDKPYMVSMANAGPNTNSSQFFITTEKAFWLDDKHTIFGRVIKGMDVVHRIENVKVWKEKPVDDVKIVNINIE